MEIPFYCIKITNLNLSSVFNNYEYISENALDLNCFINNYKQSEKSEYKEENNQIIHNNQGGKKTVNFNFNKEKDCAKYN